MNTLKNTFRKTMIAGAAGIAMIAAGSVAAPTDANANGKLVGALIGGAVVGAIIGAASQPAYAAPVYCSWQDQFKGYDAYGRAVYHRVQVCG